MSFNYTPHERVSLRGHPTLNEQWLQDRIAEDPAIMGLGDLSLIERERPQYNAGRLDLLLSDGEGQRFEVELQLGRTDASHIIRTIEYWDIERRRYPGYDHCGVIVAEDITSRFLNVLALFAGSIPLIAIQLSAIRVGDQITLHFAKVIDQRDLRVDDENPKDDIKVDRAYWEAKASQHTLQICDQILGIVNEKADGAYALAHLKHRIGLTKGPSYTNFIRLFPRKEHVRIVARVPDATSWMSQCDEVGLDADVTKQGNLRINVTPSSLGEHLSLVTDILHRAVEEHDS